MTLWFQSFVNFKRLEIKQWGFHSQLENSFLFLKIDQFKPTWWTQTGGDILIAKIVWSRTIKIPDVNTGPLACPFARLLALLCLLCLNTPMRSLGCSLDRSLLSLWDSKWLDGFFGFFAVVLDRSAVGFLLNYFFPITCRDTFAKIIKDAQDIALETNSISYFP